MDMRRLGFASSAAEEEEEEEALVEKFANVTLNSGPGSTFELPFRPYAPDCTILLRTGDCKFGVYCRFNHPKRMPGQVVEDNYREGSLENSPQNVCKYYLEAGGCKYGESCRYIHSKGESKLQHNFLECPFYMRNGTCAYGARCVFHHPNPTSMGGLNPSTTLNDEFVGESHYSLGNHDAGESLHFSGTSPLDLTSWPLEASHMSSDKTLSFPSYSSSHSSSHSERKEYLGPGYLYQRSGLSQSTRVSNASVKNIESFEQAKAMQSEKFPERPGQPECAFFMKTGDCKFKYHCRFHHPKGRARKSDCLLNDKGSFEQAKTMQSEEFPERPGQPECAFFMKTGDCKFKYHCRFHHPKGWARKSDCLLNDKGLPLRPGQSICHHYERFGICKFGSACLYNHPVDHGLLISPTWSEPDYASCNDAEPWKTNVY